MVKWWKSFDFPFISPSSAASGSQWLWRHPLRKALPWRCHSCAKPIGQPSHIVSGFRSVWDGLGLLPYTESSGEILVNSGNILLFVKHAKHGQPNWIKSHTLEDAIDIISSWSVQPRALITSECKWTECDFATMQSKIDQKSELLC